MYVFAYGLGVWAAVIVDGGWRAIQLILGWAMSGKVNLSSGLHSDAPKAALWGWQIWHRTYGDLLPFEVVAEGQPGGISDGTRCGKLHWALDILPTKEA